MKHIVTSDEGGMNKKEYLFYSSFPKSLLGYDKNRRVLRSDGLLKIRASDIRLEWTTCPQRFCDAVHKIIEISSSKPPGFALYLGCGVLGCCTQAFLYSCLINL